MTIPRLTDLNSHWAKFPPVHITMAGAHGSGSGSTATKKPEAASTDLGELMQAFGS